MKYFEHENMIYRGEVAPWLGRAIVTERLVGGKWEPCAGSEATAARTWGNPMSEDEAKEFQGEGWPAENTKATAGA